MDWQGEKLLLYKLRALLCCKANLHNNTCSSNCGLFNKVCRINLMVLICFLWTFQFLFLDSFCTPTKLPPKPPNVSIGAQCFQNLLMATKAKISTRLNWSFFRTVRKNLFRLEKRGDNKSLYIAFNCCLPSIYLSLSHILSIFLSCWLSVLQ